MPDIQSITYRIRFFCSEKKISISKFEKTAGLSNGTINTNEKRGSSFLVENVLKIKDAFRELSIIWLLTGEGEMLETETKEVGNQIKQVSVGDGNRQEINISECVEKVELCVIKFFLAAHKESKKRFQMKTNLFEMPGIISTCINILVDFYDDNPYRSFGFIGMNDEDEPKSNTKRFRVYKQIMVSVFSSTQFKHITNVEKSAYLLLNLNNQTNNPNLANHIGTFFESNYGLPFLDDWDS